MTSSRSRSLFALALVAAAALGPADASGPVGVDRLPVSPRAIIGFEHDVDASTVTRLAATGITHMVRLDSIDAVGVLGPASAYTRIATWPDVAYVDEDSPIRFDNFGAKRDTNVNRARAGRGRLSRRYNGGGSVVAVIDTGIDATHPDLAGQVIKHVNFEPGWFFDMITDGVYSDRLVEATGNPIDTYGHGTHVAGIVAGTGAGGAGADFSGVAPGAKLVNLKIADIHQGVTCSVPCDFGWELNALVAYEWLIENRNDPQFGNGIRIATNSWSVFEVDSGAEPITLIVKEAARRGIINIFAAGNEGPDPGTVARGPNRLEEVITVAAACKTAGYTDTSRCAPGGIASFSSRGRQVDIAAPGVDIYSAMARASVLSPIGGHEPPPGPGADPAFAGNVANYVAFSGTSMATPHVAGIVALMLQANPRLGRAQVEQILIDTAGDRGDPGFDTAFGYGLVNAYRAVLAAERAA